MSYETQLNCSPVHKSNKCVNCGVRLIAFCGVLDDQSISKLDKISKEKKIIKGQHIFFQGDDVKTYFNIKHGSIKLYKLSKDGRKQIVGFLYPGDFMGMSSDNLYTYSAEALEDTKICLFNKTVLENFFLKYPEVETKILNLVNHELSAAQDQIFLLGKFSAKERLLQFFLNISSQREKLGWVANPIRLSMSRSDIGNYLGITIETVSRTLSDLKKNQTIRMVGTNDIYLNFHKEELSQNLI